MDPVVKPRGDGVLLARGRKKTVQRMVAGAEDFDD
jgi:hypothetical protein